MMSAAFLRASAQTITPAKRGTTVRSAYNSAKGRRQSRAPISAHAMRNPTIPEHQRTTANTAITAKT